MLLSPDDWRPFPRVDQRQRWLAIPDAARAGLLAQAEQYSQKEVPSLPATLYLQFQRDGNRSNYQNVWYGRRQMLHSLVLGECIEGKGRFLDPLADCIWAICEESAWTWPAHINRQKAGSGLPDTTEPVVALFSAETASSLAWTVYLLGDQLDAVSPLIRKRIVREIDQRILTPYLQRDDFGWMAFGVQSKLRRPNNWNPWINSNVLAAALLVETDETQRTALAHKVLRCLDNWLVFHPTDGSCDEGPSYWDRAGASLFDNLELLYSATDGQFDLFDESLVKEIGRFIVRAHIAKDYFVVVGDCDARNRVERDLVFRYGRRIDDPHMQALALADLDPNELLDRGGGLHSLGRSLYELFNLPALLAAPEASAPLLRDVWLGDEDLQLMAARDREGTSDGFYLAAWAGHNGQSHNHNDVGNLVIYVDGQPFIIDVGRPTYTRQTFSRDRYKIWAMQSAYHNVPTVNHKQQPAGGKYHAREVRYQVTETSATLTMDLAPSYPADAGIQTWHRHVRLVRHQRIEVEDAFRLARADHISQHFMTPCQVTAPDPGQLVLTDPQTQLALRLAYDPAQLQSTVETINLKDRKLRRIWGNQLRRILLVARDPSPQQAWTVTFTRLN